MVELVDDTYHVHRGLVWHVFTTRLSTVMLQTTLVVLWIVVDLLWNLFYCCAAVNKISGDIRCGSVCGSRTSCTPLSTVILSGSIWPFLLHDAMLMQYMLWPCVSTVTMRLSVISRRFKRLCKPEHIHFGMQGSLLCLCFYSFNISLLAKLEVLTIVLPIPKTVSASD